MKLMRFTFLAFALLFLSWCGDSSSKEDGGDTTTDPVAEEAVGDTVVDDVATDLPADEIGDQVGDEAGEVLQDILSDETHCPDPPVCEEPLVLGTGNALDESGCVVSYCCTGIEIMFDNVIVTEGTDLHSHVHGYARAENTGEVDVMSAYMECEIRDPDGGTVLGACDRFDVISPEEPIEVGATQSFDFDLDCDWPAGACGEEVSLVCTYYWETIGCYSNGEATIDTTTFVVCPP